MSRHRMAKKALAGILSAAFILAGLSVHAENGNTTSGNTTGGSTIVEFSQASEWLVTIPSSVTLSTTDTKSSEITATKINIAPDKELQVSVSSGISEGVVTLTRKNDEKKTTITSTVSLEESGDGIKINDVVAVFTGTATGSESDPIKANKDGTLYFSALEGDIAAGSYTGTITFTMKLADVSSSGTGLTEETGPAETP